MKRHHYILTGIVLTILVGISSFTIHSIRKTMPVAEAAAQASFSLSPSSQGYTKGNTISVAVNVSLNASYNVAQADMYYNSSLFQYSGGAGGGSYNGGVTITKKSNGFGSYLSIAGSRSSGGSLPASNTLATINFQAINPGTGYLNFANLRAVNYPSTEYSTSGNNGSYTITNPAPPSQPPATPPASTPSAPKPPASSTKAPSSAPKTGPVAATKSQASTAGLSIANLAIKDASYNTATITWTTNRASNSKINFGTFQEDLSSEKREDKQTTDHSITLGADEIKAGRHYYFRITSDDGKGPATMDSVFDTKTIPVVIQVTDQNNKSVSGADVSIDDKQQTTDENGNANFELAEGDVTILAKKGDLQREVTATVDVPVDDTPQQITLALGKAAAQTSKKVTPKKSSLTWLWITLLLIIVGGIIGFIFWRRSKNNSESYSDPLEAESYTSDPIPSTPQLPPVEATPTPVNEEAWAPPQLPVTDPQYLPVQDPSLPHHSTLPELVANYGESNPGASPELPTPLPVSPTGQAIPQHSSLKDLVALPSNNVEQDEPIVGAPPDLPMSPLSDRNEELSSTDETEHLAKHDKSDHNKTSQSDNGELSIKH